MLRTGILTLLVAVGCGSLFAQVVIDKPVRLQGTSDSLRRVTNVDNADSLNDGLNAQTFQDGQFIYQIANGTDSLYFDLQPAIPNYTAGMRVNFLVTITNTGPSKLDINSLGPVPLLKNGMEELNGQELIAGQPVSAIFDGTAFQLISNNQTHCPVGFAHATRQYCIETNERAASSFWTAVTTCYDINARLCTWGEWYYACQKAGLGLVDMTNNYEWCDNGANEDRSARVAGSSSCTTASTGDTAVNTYSFRCCFSK